ncbi:hypothetical protein [Natronorarus salvus]|uniref:hypothetical protein n=1 Tax=Natronorarus salvus TaxID=3117733 RepID=UPI002F266D49
MTPLQTVDVLVLSLLAIVVYALAGAVVARDARERNVKKPAVWGGSVFLAMLLGTLFVPNQTLGAVVGGLLVIGLYVVVRD